MNEIMPIVEVVAIVAIARWIHVAFFTRYFKLTYSDAPAWTFLYFSGWTLLITLIFPNEIATLFKSVSSVGYLVLLFLFVVVFPIIYGVLRASVGVPEWLAKVTPDEPILTLEGRFILAKTADVFFQQLAAGVIILTLAAHAVAYPTIILIFLALFVLAHVYIFFTSGFFWGLYYTTFAALGAFAIPFFILFVPGGIFYALIFHMLFYVLSAALFAKLPRPKGKHVYHDLIGTAPAY